MIVIKTNGVYYLFKCLWVRSWWHPTNEDPRALVPRITRAHPDTSGWPSFVQFGLFLLRPSFSLPRPLKLLLFWSFIPAQQCDRSVLATSYCKVLATQYQSLYFLNSQVYFHWQNITLSLHRILQE